MSIDCELLAADYQVDFETILREHHNDFRETLNVQALLPLMTKNDLLTVQECQEITCKAIDAEKIDQLVIHVLPRKGKLACQKFIKCLESEKQHSGHPELVEKLKQTVAKLISGQPQSHQFKDKESKTKQVK